MEWKGRCVNRVESKSGVNGRMKRKSCVNGVERKNGVNGVERKNGVNGVERKSGVSGVERKSGVSGVERNSGVSGVERKMCKWRNGREEWCQWGNGKSSVKGEKGRMPEIRQNYPLKYLLEQPPATCDVN